MDAYRRVRYRPIEMIEYTTPNAQESMIPLGFLVYCSFKLEYTKPSVQESMIPLGFLVYCSFKQAVETCCCGLIVRWGRGTG